MLSITSMVCRHRTSRRCLAVIHCRMLSNRESARRSRKRKQEHMHSLELQLEDIAEQKREKEAIADMAERKCRTLEDENQRLREENDRLRDELRFLRSEVRAAHNAFRLCHPRRGSCVPGAGRALALGGCQTGSDSGRVDCSAAAAVLCSCLLLSVCCHHKCLLRPQQQQQPQHTAAPYGFCCFLCQLHFGHTL